MKYKVVAYNSNKNFYDTLFVVDCFSDAYNRAKICAELCEKDKLRTRSGERFDHIEIYNEDNSQLIWTSLLPEKNNK